MTRPQISCWPFLSAISLLPLDYIRAFVPQNAPGGTHAVGSCATASSIVATSNSESNASPAAVRKSMAQSSFPAGLQRPSCNVFPLFLSLSLSFASFCCHSVVASKMSFSTARFLAQLQIIMRAQWILPWKSRSKSKYLPHRLNDGKGFVNSCFRPNS